jgi:hypothetical protein
MICPLLGVTEAIEFLVQKLGVVLEPRKWVSVSHGGRLEKENASVVLSKAGTAAEDFLGRRSVVSLSWHCLSTVDLRKGRGKYNENQFMLFWSSP